MSTMRELFVQLQQIDYSILLSFFKPIIILYLSQFTTSKAIKAYSLHKDYKPKDISMVIIPPELIEKHKDVDVDKIATLEFRDSIFKFVEVMTKKFPLEYLTNFYNNINDLKVETKELKKSFGKYVGDSNTIIIDSNSSRNSTIFHELFHMSSSIYDHNNGVIHIGFMQVHIKPNFQLGKGLNEGYTDLLTQRYFESSKESSYIYEKLISSFIEEIVGKEKMEQLYLNANLKGLIDELALYTSENEIMAFISNLDFVTLHLYDKNISSLKKDMIEKCLKNISRFLIICYSKKISKDYKSYSEKMVNFVSRLSFNPIVNDHKYVAITDEVVLASLQAARDERNNLKVK